MERFHRMADAAPVLIWMSGTDKLRTWLNQRWLDFVGRPMEAELGNGWVDNVHPEDLDTCLSAYASAFDRREAFSTEYRLKRHDGAYRWVLDNGVPLHDAEGAFSGYIGSCVDITDRRAAEESTRRATEQLQLVADTMSALVTRCSRDYRYVWISKSCAAWLGVSPADVIGRPIVEVIGKTTFQQLLPHFHRVLAGERVEYIEPVRYPETGERWVHAVYTPTRDAQGLVDGWVAVLTDLTEHKRLENALAEVNRRKDAFLATLAHELRNPLAPMRNALQILRMKGQATGDAQWARDVIERQMAQMSRLIDDLLDMSRITQDRLELRKAAVDLRTVLEVAIETSHPLLQQQRQELSLSMPRHPAIVDGDATRLAQVFANLLNNAAKFSERPGTIALVVEEDDDTAVVTIRDEGIGISAESLPGIFDLFSNIGSATDGGGGLGIGLTLAKRLVEMHGGAIESASDGTGRGSTFTVRLPLLRGAKTEHPAASDPLVEAVGTRRVLVVDDNEDGATSLSKLLGMLGYDIRVALNGPAAIAEAEDFRPDVVLLDLGMPGMSGYEVARRIRETRWGRKVKLVALTGWGQQEDKDRTREAGFDLHLVKPVDPASLTRLLAVPV